MTERERKPEKAGESGENGGSVLDGPAAADGSDDLELKAYTVVWCPFEMSDLTSEATEYGADAEDARKEFERKHPKARVKSVKLQYGQ